MLTSNHPNWPQPAIGNPENETQDDSSATTPCVKCTAKPGGAHG